MKAVVESTVEGLEQDDAKGSLICLKKVTKAADNTISRPKKMEVAIVPTSLRCSMKAGAWSAAWQGEMGAGAIKSANQRRAFPNLYS